MPKIRLARWQFETLQQDTVERFPARLSTAASQYHLSFQTLGRAFPAEPGLQKITGKPATANQGPAQRLREGSFLPRNQALDLGGQMIFYLLEKEKENVFEGFYLTSVFTLLLMLISHITIIFKF